MRFDVITLFPDLFTIPLTQGVTRRAFDEGRVQVRTWPLRDFADGPHRRVDDRPTAVAPGW
jgi:tRNA (guanine37-N1)-methyltransferase